MEVRCKFRKVWHATSLQGPAQSSFQRMTHIVIETGLPIYNTAVVPQNALSHIETDGHQKVQPRLRSYGLKLWFG